MNLYELTYLIKPELTSNESKSLNKDFADKLKGMDAKLYKMEQPKKINLAYRLKGFSEAYMVSIDMDVDSEKVKLIEEELKRKKEVLRHIIISKEKIEEEEDPKKANQEEESNIENKKDNKEGNDKSEEEDNEEEKEDESDSKKEDKKVKLNEIDEKIDEIL